MLLVRVVVLRVDIFCSCMMEDALSLALWMNTVTYIKHDTLYITQCATMAWGSNGTELEAKSPHR